MSWAARVGVISVMASLGALMAESGCSPVTVPSAAPPGDAGSVPVDSAVSVDSTSPPPLDSAYPALDGGGTCMPGDVSMFTATWHPPVGPYLGACTDDQLTLLIAACFDKKATAATCSVWLNAPANSTCEGCWAGQALTTTPGPWAPFLYTENPGQADFVNVPDCVALADPSRTQCAHELQAAFECELSACLANCPVPMTGTTNEKMTALDSLSACFQAADMGGCAMLVQQADACIPGDGGADAGPSSFCYDAAADTVALRQYFALVCGHAPPEAGTAPDAGDGG